MSLTLGKLLIAAVCSLPLVTANGLVRVDDVQVFAGVFTTMDDCKAAVIALDADLRYCSNERDGGENETWWEAGEDQ